ncbi:hypothetical protein BJX96DRAFT_183631 [Aspergillus floccosus]
MNTYLRFLYNQFLVHPALPDDASPFAGQTIIITGSNVGLGLEAARHMARLGAEKLILAVRNVAAGEAARTSIEASTGRTGVCEVWPLDLSSFSSVQAFARRAAQQLCRLDAVVANAAIATNVFDTAEGYERTLTVNVLSTILLGMLLLPTLRASARAHPRAPKPRLSIVVSEVHGWAVLPECPEGTRLLDVLSNEETADMNGRYPVSKLLAVLAIREMVARLRDDAVVVNMLNPGFCHSQLARDAPGVGIKVMKMLLARSTEEGSRTLVAGAAAGDESHGEYMENGVVAPDAVSAFVRSEEGARMQRRVWGEIVEVLEGVEPGVTGNL